MEFTGLIALATAIVTAIAAHLKNVAQDGNANELRQELEQVKANVERCEEERALLFDLLLDDDDDDDGSLIVM